MTKKQMLQSALLLTGMILTSTVLLATPPGGGGGAGAPIDGGITLLLGAGASYGIKKLKDRKKKD